MFPKTYPKIYRIPDGEGNGGGSGDGSGSGDGDGDGKKVDAGGKPLEFEGKGGITSVKEGERPEHIPEKFWDTDAKTIKTEDLGKAYTELETVHRNGKDALREEIRNELENRDGVPESADKYEFGQPKIDLPEGLEWKVEENDPMMAFWRELSFDRKYTQEEFQSGIDKYAQATVDRLPTKKKEMEALGSSAEARIAAVDTWLEAKLPADEYKAFVSISDNANLIKGLERIMQGTKQGIGGDAENLPGSGDGGTVTKADLVEAMKDPRYHDSRKRDPAYIKQVTAMAAKVAAQEQAGKAKQD